MSPAVRRTIRVILIYAIGWTLAFMLLSILRTPNLQDFAQLELSPGSRLLIVLAVGPLAGILSGYAQLFLEDRLYRKMSLGRLLMLRFLYMIVFIMILTVLFYVAFRSSFGTDLDLFTFNKYATSYSVYIYVFVVDFILNGFRLVDIMLGEGNFFRFLGGRFYQPREEHRIFMFLDLQSSTQLAEKLGHFTYSRFIQDCFYDLGIVMNQYAEIYQYVGDEAVLTWPMDQGLKDANCLEAFFAFTKALKEKSDYYLKEYGHEPVFKAGLHGGLVTVTEIGRYKKEIAYHGDPVNTAARIQGECNTLNQELLISEELKNQIQANSYSYRSVGSVSLRGKEDSSALFGVEKS